MRVLVVDDEKLSRDELKYLLSRYPHIEICGEASNGEAALTLYRHLKPDVVFLDIKMPGMGGLAVADRLKQEKDPPAIVFATAYDQHAIKAFELDAVDYLLKPFSPERLHLTIERLQKDRSAKDRLVDRLERLLSRLENDFPRRDKLIKLTAEVDERLIVLKHPELVYAYTEGRHVYLKVKDRAYRSHYTMKELEERLPRPPFVRCHRGYLVNIDWVKEIHAWFSGTYRLIMKDHQRSEVLVSRSHAKEIKELFYF